LGRRGERLLCEQDRVRPKERDHRRSIRLKGYDYALPGDYFVTIVCQGRRCLLDPGPVRTMVNAWWAELPSKFASMECDSFVIMPNHIHGIITIVGADERGRIDACCIQQDRACPDPEGGHIGPPLRGSKTAPTLAEIVQWFKAMTTNAYIRGVRDQGWERFAGRLRQRGYYEHIVRSECSLEQIRDYIAHNPLLWDVDAENPSVHTPAVDAYYRAIWRTRYPYGQTYVSAQERIGSGCTRRCASKSPS